MQCTKGPEARIREMFSKVELSVSSYETAWVAMVPSPDYPHQPCFPECLNWLLENQHPDGSWGLSPRHPLLIKDYLASTLVCVIVLGRWKVGKEQVKKGIDFLGSNFGAATDEKQYSPIGFDIIFPGFGIGGLLLIVVFETHSAFSYLDAPEATEKTAAALTHLHDDKCFEYLHSLLKRFGNAVPTVYPQDIYTGLCKIDSLERLGIDRHFKNEIKNVLNQTFRCWQQGDEEIFSDITTCAMAFRLLRMNGYDVSEDALSEFNEEEQFFNLARGFLKVTDMILELYRASQCMIFLRETVLEKLNSWTSRFLKQELSDNALNEKLHEEVDCALKYPYASLERLENKRNIEHYNVENFRVLKTSYRWVKENRLDQLKFARQKLTYAYFSVSSILFSPELSAARMSWTKNVVLTTVIDDFFDVGGSREELVNLIKLVEDSREIDIGSVYVAVAYFDQINGGRGGMEEVVRSPEYNSLLKHMNICGRLLNDVQGFEREGKEGKMNSVLLYMIHEGGDVTEEDAVRELRGMIERSRREVLRLVVQRKGSMVPKACKDLFWRHVEYFIYFT
ncbi:hypothetical protein HHK36_004635 [Tetracentron sinense]|uniref:Uncharacterized protein n=1 Tax=Tetracentron sinense TaxID=13715 RepID=A0A835DQE4_TETSI|nr:hypothetical protein HHK36_004635 [Tetracentron sinense]